MKPTPRRRTLDLAAHDWRGYMKGCRCAECRTDWARYIREWKHAKGVCKPRARFYEGPFAASTVKLTPLALQLLATAAAREGRPTHDVVEQLVREHAGDVAFAQVA